MEKERQVEGKVGAGGVGADRGEGEGEEEECDFLKMIFFLTFWQIQLHWLWNTASILMV